MNKGIDVKQIKAFLITGVDREGKRFRITTSSYKQACMYNIWQGNVWALLKNDKRKLLKRVIN